VAIFAVKLGLAEKDYRAKIDATEPENGIFGVGFQNLPYKLAP
jgi:hypothetical protein